MTLLPSITAVTRVVRPVSLTPVPPETQHTLFYHTAWFHACGPVNIPICMGVSSSVVVPAIPDSKATEGLVLVQHARMDIDRRKPCGWPLRGGRTTYSHGSPEEQMSQTYDHILRRLGVRREHISLPSRKSRLLTPRSVLIGLVLYCGTTRQQG
jgi:hypothetical protein